MEEDKNKNENGTWKVTESMGYYELVVNDHNVVGEKYTLSSDGPFQIEDEIDVYRMRKLENQYLVKVYDVKSTQSNSLCYGQGSLKIITQRIPYRLDQVSHLNAHEALYVLYRCLKGYKIICQMLGPALIEDKMIGIDSYGKVKVWINENYSRNYSQGGNKIASVKDKAIQKMVMSIIDSIKTKTYNLPEELVMKLKRIMSTSMEQHVLVIEKHLKEKKIDLSRIRISVGKQRQRQEDPPREGAKKEYLDVNENHYEIGDQYSGSMMEGIPQPVAQLVNKVFKPKFLHNQEKEKEIKEYPRYLEEEMKVQGKGKEQTNRKNQLLVPPGGINPQARNSPMPQGRPMSNYANNAPNVRGFSPMPAGNPQVRPSSNRPNQHMMPPQQHLQFPQFPMKQGQLYPSRGLSPRPTSPRPLSPNPQFVNQLANNQNFVQPQIRKIQQAPIPFQQPGNPRKQQINHKPSNQKSKQSKKSNYMAESECFPLGTMPQNQHPPMYQPHPQQYQQMIFQQLNVNPMNQLFGQQILSPQMFSPPQYLQAQIPSNILLSPPSNMHGMPPPMSHLNNPNIQSLQQQHQFIHSQIMQNLQNHLNGQKGGGFLPTFKRM